MKIFLVKICRRPQNPCDWLERCRHDFELLHGPKDAKSSSRAHNVPAIFQGRTDDGILNTISINNPTIYLLIFSGTKSSTSILELSGT